MTLLNFSCLIEKVSFDVNVQDDNAKIGLLSFPQLEHASPNLFL